MNNNLLGSKYRMLNPLAFSLAFVFLTLLPEAVRCQIKPLITKPVVRAVIIGISDYEHAQIVDLRFAHADAKAYADYLRSPAGGSVDESNIQLLTNEKAKLGNIVSALTWLVEESKSGDQAIIYFSGHGDMESLSGLSFLLAFNASANAYSGGGGLAVVILQSIIKRLSTEKQVQVLLITDACRAGKLAGNEIGGTQATAKVLSDQFANEVKILSCQPDEFSLEGTEWGGGRGVFSYYLINGLSGLADNSKDMSVSLMEIGRYLEENVSTATAPHSQIPMVVGSKGMSIAQVDAKTLADLQSRLQQNNSNGIASIATRSASNRDTTDEKLRILFEEAIAHGHLLTPLEGSAFQILAKLKERPSQQEDIGMFRRNLAAELQNDAQVAINDYLTANPRELRKRWSLDNRYDKFPLYLEKAAELLGKVNFMYEQLKAREHYFRGLNLRLTAQQTNDDSKLKLAQAEQLKALQFDPKAVFAINELGHLAILQEQSKMAVDYFAQASALSPKWVLPWSNMCLAYIKLRDYPQAEKYGLMAVGLDSTFAWANSNLGVVYERTKDFKKAIYYISRAIKFDPEFATSYYNLGLAYYHLSDYTSAKNIWEEYQKRMPDDPDGYQCLGEAASHLNDPAGAEAFFKKALGLNPKYEGALFSLGELYLAQGQLEVAADYVAQFQQLKPEDPEGYFLMACIQVKQQQDDKALMNLEQALNLGMKEVGRLNADQRLGQLRNTERFKSMKKKYFPGKS